MKKAMCMGLAALAAVILVACGAKQTNAPAAGETAFATTANAIVSSVADASQAVSESAAATTVAETSASSTASSSAGKTTQTAKAATTTATTTTRYVAPVAAALTATTRRTTAMTAPQNPQAAPPAKPVYTEADCAEIVAAVRAYAESKTKVKFVWDASMTFEAAKEGRYGYHDTPNLTRAGKKSVTDDLKYNADLTEDIVTNPAYGVPSGEIRYNVVWFVDQQNIWGFGNGDICFALIYG